MSDPSSTKVLLVLTIWGAGLGAAAQFGKIAVIFDRLAQVYAGHGGALGLGFMVSVVGLGGLILGTTAGLFVERLGHRRVLVGGMALGGVLSLIQASLPAYGLMMATRAAEGLSQAAIVVAGPVLIAQVTAQRHQGMAMSLWGSFFGVSFALTAWLGLPLVEAHGPAALFLAHGIYMLVFAGLIWLLAPPDRVESGLPPLTLAEVARLHVRIYASPFVAAPGLGFVFYTTLYVAMLTILPQLVDASVRQWVAVAMPLSSTVVSLTLGVWLLRRVPAVTLVQAGFAVAFLGAVLLWLAWGQGAAVVLVSVLVSSALGLVQGASFASIPQLNATAGDRARAAGAVAQLGNLGTTSGTPALAALTTGFGITGLLAFAVPLCLGGIVLHGWMRRRRAAASV